MSVFWILVLESICDWFIRLLSSGDKSLLYPVCKLDELGDGTFGKVVVFGNGDNSGHAFVIAKLEGQVKILDGQSEQIIPRDQFAGWVNKNKAEKGWSNVFHFFKVSEQ